MKILLLKENLKKGLNIIERITPKSITLPILGNVLLSCEKNFLKLSSTNLEIAVNYWVLCKTEEEGRVTTPAKLLSSLIKSFDSEKITIEEKNNNLFIQGEKETLTLKCQNAEDFPIIPHIKDDQNFKVNLSPFCHSLAQVIDTVSTSQNRPETCGVYFKVNKDGITLAATDTFRLSEKIIKFSKEHTLQLKDEYVFIVPAKTLYEVMSAFSDQEGYIKISLDDSQIGFEYYSNETGHIQVQFLSKLIDGEFPHYQEIIPQKFDAEIQLVKNDFMSKIKAAGILNSKTNEVSLSINSKRKGLEIQTQNPDLGEYNSFVPGVVSGTDVNLDFNWKFILSGLLNIKSQEVVLAVQKNGGPAMIRPVGDDSYIYIAMPIRSS